MDGELVIPKLPGPSNNSKNIALHKSLNIDLYGVSSISKVFPTCVGKFQKENIKVLMENQLFKMIREKMIIFLTRFLSNNS